MGAYSNKGKLWVSIIEKAYLKSHGGYDFPGSNSSRDLFILTGWLPERIQLHKTDQDKLWTRIHNGYKNLDCLISCGTGPLDELEEEATGLVSGHAYAVLEVMEYKGLKMLLVKNPWGHQSYKGKFSIDDHKSWTPELKKVFGYEHIAKKDNGVFWIEIHTFCQ